MAEITYRVGEPIEVEEFIRVLNASTLGERRPVHDRPVMESMLRHGNLLVTACEKGKLIGVARTITDFSYAAYLSELAVDRDAQGRGVGTELIRRTQRELGPRCTLILLSAPAAVDFYPRIGFERHPEAWILPPGRELLS